MQEMTITSVCDMTYAETGQREPPEQTVYLAFGDDPRRLEPVQLDLTGDWARKLREAIGPYLAAGHAPGEVITPGARLAGRDRVNDPGVREHLAAMRAWCDETGFTPRYRKLDKGGYYYPLKLKAAYKARLAGLAGTP